jgi:hypothetical protein
VVVARTLVARREHARREDAAVDAAVDAGRGRYGVREGS